MNGIRIRGWKLKITHKISRMLEKESFLKNIDLIVQSVEFIEHNLQEDISVLGISRRMGYSHFYFSRLFHSVTGHNPLDYIQKRRLTESVKELISTKRKIIDIALDYQYNLQAMFIWLAMVVVISILASVMPARNATAISVRESLAYA